MNSKMHSALAAWTLFSLLNRSDEHDEWVKDIGLNIQEESFTLLPGYNQCTAGQLLEIELTESPDGRFIWQLNTPDNIEILNDTLQDHYKHTWDLKATRPGRYKVTADYVDTKRKYRIKRRVLFEIEALPVAGREQ